MSSHEQVVKDTIEQNDASLQAKADYRDPQGNKREHTLASEQTPFNEAEASKFPGGAVYRGRTGQTGGGTNPQQIPPSEGGELTGLRNADSGPTSSTQFEGAGGPETKQQLNEENRAGDNDIKSNVSQSHEPKDGPGTTVGRK